MTNFCANPKPNGANHAQPHQRVERRPQPRLRSLRHRAGWRGGAEAARGRPVPLVARVCRGGRQPFGGELLHQVQLRLIEFGARALRAFDQEPIAVERHAGRHVTG
ncbi:hypothetical protein [Nocardia asiatica]